MSTAGASGGTAAGGNEPTVRTRSASSLAGAAADTTPPVSGVLDGLSNVPSSRTQPEPASLSLSSGTPLVLDLSKVTPEAVWGVCPLSLWRCGMSDRVAEVLTSPPCTKEITMAVLLAYTLDKTPLLNRLATMESKHVRQIAEFLGLPVPSKKQQAVCANGTGFADHAGYSESAS